MEEKNTQKISLLQRLKTNPRIIRNAIIALVAGGLLIGGAYWYQSSKRVYTDKAELSAPLIALSPEQPGVLKEIMVKNGEQVAAYQPVAKMENGYVRAKTDGIIVDASTEIGKLFSPGTAVVTMINPDDMKVIAHVAEDKGLSSIHPGQKVIFTVDAYGSKKFIGTVEEIANTSDQSSVVFSISDKRVEKDFSVKIKYDSQTYPELLNGMSAKAWIYK